MILGVGSDIIHIPRIAKAIENPRCSTARSCPMRLGRRRRGSQGRLQCARRQWVSHAYGSRSVMKKNMRRHIVFWRDHYEYRICIGYADD